MTPQLETREWSTIDADWLIVGMTEHAEFRGSLARLDDTLEGQCTRLREAGDLSGQAGELLVIHDVPGLAAQRLLITGLGPADQLTLAGAEKSLSAAVRKVSEQPGRSAAIVLPQVATSALSAAQLADTAARCAVVSGVGQDLYQREPSHHALTAVSVGVEDGDEGELTAAIERGGQIGAAINLTRELVNRAAHDIYPETFAQRAQEESDALGLKCTVLGEDEIRSEKMGALLAVAQGSDRPPRVVMLEYRGGDDNAPTLAIVGKGVTFDSGGLSLKPSDSMLTMKCDMAGAATALGAITGIARLKLPVNVIALLGLVENMISGSSYKLGDVLTARNGVTIEVHNTDAEGRLVLADVLSYAVDQGADQLIDLATLTGACVVALGEEITGAFSNDVAWQNSVTEAAERQGELIWPMPMHGHFAELLKSDVADCKNVGPRWGGAVTAAKFLEKFVSEKPWVHLDIAGPSFAASNQPHREGGATGCMVRTLIDVAANFGKS